MRVVLMSTMTASVLAIGLTSAQALSTRNNAAAPDTAVRLVQQKDTGPGTSGPGPSTGPSGPSMRSPSQGPAQGQSPAMGPGPGGPGGGKLRGEGGAQFRSGERGMGYGPRTGEGSRTWIGRDRDRGDVRGYGRRHFGERGFQVGPRFGYVADCSWLRRRALDTGSRYWWRQYRECRSY